MCPINLTIASCIFSFPRRVRIYRGTAEFPCQSSRQRTGRGLTSPSLDAALSMLWNDPSFSLLIEFLMMALRLWRNGKAYDSWSLPAKETRKKCTTNFAIAFLIILILFSRGLQKRSQQDAVESGHRFYFFLLSAIDKPYLEVAFVLQNTPSFSLQVMF